MLNEFNPKKGLFFESIDGKLEVGHFRDYSFFKKGNKMGHHQLLKVYYIITLWAIGCGGVGGTDNKSPTHTASTVSASDRPLEEPQNKKQLEKLKLENQPQPEEQLIKNQPLKENPLKEPSLGKLQLVDSRLTNGLLVDQQEQVVTEQPDETATEPTTEVSSVLTADAGSDRDDEIVKAPVNKNNPFDNPEMATSDESVPSETQNPNYDPNRPMQVWLDFKEPGEILPFPAPDPKQYKKWKQKGRMRVGHSHLDSVCFSPEGRYLLAMSENEGTVRIYNSKTKKMVKNYSILGTTSFSRFDVLFWPVIEDEPLVLFAKQNGLMLYRAIEGEPLSYLRQVDTTQIRWSDDLETLVGYGRLPNRRGKLISFYKRKSPPDLELIKQVETKHNIMEVDISRDNRLFAIADYSGGQVILYSLETGDKLWSARVPGPLWTVDISPDGTKVAGGGSSVVIFDINDPKRKTTYRKFNNNINRVRFSPSGDAVFVSSYDGHIRIIAADLSNEQGRLLKKLRHGGTANVYEMDFTKNGNRMASVSGDKTVRIWGGRKK